MQCRLCDSHRLLSVLDLGASPPCESFLTADELDLPEVTFSVHLRLCEECLLLQIPALTTAEESLTRHPYFASASETLVKHAKTFFDEAVERLDLGTDSFVVEIGSNDGYLLQHAVTAGIPCLGIEPSADLGTAARKRGVPTLSAFPDESVARRVRAEYGSADLVVANNVYAQVPNLLGITQSLRGLLADDGWLSIEVHHALNLIRRGHFDVICHLRFQYYTLLTAIRSLATAGLAIVDVELLPACGSIRIWARPARIAQPPTDRVAEVLRTEQVAGLRRATGYMQLRSRAEAVRHDLLRFLLMCRADGKRVVGYGATGKANTLLNYCGIRSDLLEYIVDGDPYKHGRFTPGTRIPIYDPGLIANDCPDVILALPWQDEAKLTDQLSYIGDWGAELVFALPTMHRAIGLRSENVGTLLL